ncbi:endonuclease [Crocinitomicaceae bacterium]|nr:endonuclease [Crocinitomicaceae bacterium]
MKKVFLIGVIILIVNGLRAQANIADARTYGLGQTVSVTGVVTNGAELGSIRYMQDVTAGIAGYGGPVTGANRGDSVTITGPLIEFSGLLEISTVATMVNHGQAIVQPSPLQIPIPTVDEALESQLVEIQNVTFTAGGNFAGGNSTVQVSDGVNTLDVRINGTTNIAGTFIPSGPVTITGLVGQFNTNYQIVLRDLNDIVPYVAPLYEINVLLEGATVLNNGNYFVGNSAVTNVTIENLGSTDLVLSGANFTGVNAGDFSTDIAPLSIAASSSQSFVINYAASGLGSHFAAIEIGSNDTDENPYIINFEGAGTDNLATEPIANPSALTFPIVEAYTLAGQYTAGTGASKYVVLWNKGAAITDAPIDGSTYLRGDVIGNATVAYIGAGTSFTPRGVIANEDYNFVVYAFNGQGGFENYLTVAPLSGTTASLGSNIGSYYGAINSQSTSLVSDLVTLVNPHTFISYFLYKQTIMSDFEIRDTIGGQSVVTCAYSGENYIFNDPFDWSETGYSREHTMPHTWMHSYPADSPEQPEYTDQHNLYPTNLNAANIPRSNHPLGIVTGAVTSSYLEGTLGLDNNGMLVYEPRDSQKGNAARAIMYMAVTYGFNLNGDNDATDQDQDVLKEWHLNDLPDNYEIARHEYIYSIQGNRNPFIDSVVFGCHINFDNNTYLSSDCASVGIQSIDKNEFTIYPVPASEEVNISTNGLIISYTLIDMQGRTVLSVSDLNISSVDVNVKELNPGTYFIKVNTVNGSAQKKIIIE